MKGIVIIGAGYCGASAAFALRDKGFDGPIHLIGEEHELPYERPPLSKSRGGDVRTIAEFEDYAGARIELVLGQRAISIHRASRSIHFSGEGPLSYDRLLIATGASSRKIAAYSDACTLRTLTDARSITSRLIAGTRVVVICAGLIGMEFAATARMLGAEVVVIESAGRAMGRSLPSDIASIAVARHISEGVEFRFDTVVTDIAGSMLALSDGETLRAELMLASIGSVPNVELADSAGLVTHDGIVVDQYFQTTDPRIFAAGDCCSSPYMGRHCRLESWRSAHDQGVHVAGAMLGASPPYSGVPWFWSDQYDLGVQAVGRYESGLEVVRRNLDSGGTLVFRIDDSETVSYAAGIGIGAEVGKEVRIAELMIRRGVQISSSQLRDPSVNLKQIMKAGSPPAAEAIQSATS